MVSAARKATVMRGGSSHYASHYATSSAVAHGAVAHAPQPPRTRVVKPWMGEGQSRVGYAGSGFQHAYYRDKPPGDGTLQDVVTSHTAFARPKTAPLQPWQGDKNRQPLTACLQRGADKEPRYYPISVGADNNAETLIAPKEADSAERFSGGTEMQGPSIFTKKPQGEARTVENPKNARPSSGFTLAAHDGAKTLITAPQSDGVLRSPALTMLQAERVAADSTRRYFHARDFSERPFLSSKVHYEDDAISQREATDETKSRKATALSKYPETQWALYSGLKKPFAEDVGEGVGSIGGAAYGECVSDGWGSVPKQARAGLLPTGYASNYPAHTRTLTKETSVEPENGMQFLPERFMRLRKRNDYLHWGGEGPTLSTSKKELCHPRIQEPLGGVKEELVSGDVSVMYDGRRSGYELNVTPDSPLNFQRFVSAAARPSTAPMSAMR